MENRIAHTLAEILCRTYGGYPVLEIRETNVDPVMDDFYGNFAITIDTSKLNQIGDFEINYVDHIILAAVRPQAIEGMTVQVATSRKYSFSDTPDWWEKIELDSLPLGARVVHLDVVRG